MNDSTKRLGAELLAKKPEQKSALENLGEVFKGRPTKEWKLDELSEAAQSGMKGRDFVNGRTMTVAITLTILFELLADRASVVVLLGLPV